MDLEQIGPGYVNVVTSDAELVGSGHQPIEYFARDWNEVGMGDPGAVMAIAGLALLVRADLRKRGLVRRRIALDRNLRGHAAHRERAATMAGLDQQQGISLEERLAHRHVGAIGRQKGRVFAKALDERENIIPAAAVEADDVVPQLVEDLVHLEGGGQRFDQDGRLERPDGKAELFLGESERVVPEPRLDMALEFRQIESGRRARAALRLRAMEDVEAEVEQRSRNFLAVDEQVPLIEMPAAGAHHQSGGLLAEDVSLAGRRLREIDRPGPTVPEVRLALDHVGEEGRFRVLEIRHEDLRAGIERIDDHFAIDRAGDLDAAVQQIGRNRRDLPVGFPNGAGFGQKIRRLARVEQFLPFGAARERREPPRVETTMQLGEEGQGVGGQDFIVARPGGCAKLDVVEFRLGVHIGLPAGARSREHELTSEKAASWGELSRYARKRLSGGSDGSSGDDRKHRRPLAYFSSVRRPRLGTRHGSPGEPEFP